MTHQNAKLILASQSPRRLQLLAQIGITPDMVLPADINEDEQKGELPRDYALRLGIEKSAAIAVDHPACLVLGSDTAVAVGRRILPKAEDAVTARSCIELISGRSHRVYTSIGLAVPAYGDKPARMVSRIVETRVKIKRLSLQEIDAYIDDHDQWHGKAGGYGIQGSFAAHVKSIQGSYTAIVGLPVYETANLLRGNGYIW